jgi:hypothetical protein
VTDAMLSFPSRVANALVSYAVYIGQMFFPAGLAVFYPHPGQSLESWKIGAAVILLAFVTTGAFILRRRSPYVLVGWLWFLGMLVPVIGFVQARRAAVLRKAAIVSNWIFRF